MSERGGAQPRIALVYGTRPQTIKTSALLPALEEQCEVVSVDTGQHYDYELNQTFYDQLGVRAPDVFLGVGSGEPSVQCARILDGLSDVLAKTKASAVVVIGDTTSTLAASMCAKLRRLPLCHVEAGLRSGRMQMLEEVNRRAVDAISDLLCAPSELAEKSLTSEKVPGVVMNTGDVARDVLRRATPRIASMNLPSSFEEDAPFILLTVHRAELVDDIALLTRVVSEVADHGMPVVFPVHPRTRNMLGSSWKPPRNVKLLPPVGYFETMKLAMASRVIATDSGGLQREAYWLGVPCVTLRPETEWVETIGAGANTTVEIAREGAVGDGLVRQLSRAHSTWNNGAYGDGFAAEKIALGIRDILE